MNRLTHLAVCLAVLIALTGASHAADDTDIKDLVERLKDKDVAARVRAIKALEEKGQAARPAAADLIALLKEPDASKKVHPAVYRAMQRIGVDEKLLPSLLADLKGKNALAIAAAERLLGFMGEPALPALLEGLNDKNGIVRARSARALFHVRELPAKAVPPLVKLLDDPVANVRIQAISALGKMGPRAAAAVPNLIKALKAKNVLAADALGRIGPAAEEAVPALREALADTTTSIKVNYFSSSELAQTQQSELSLAEAAAIALGRLGSKAAAATPDLIKALSDERTAVRLRSAGALGEIGPEAKKAVPALFAILRDESQDRNVQAAAANALGKIGEAARPKLIETMKDKNPAVRALVAKALGQVRPVTKPAVTALGRGVADRDITVRLASVLALGEIGPEAKDAVPTLSAALRANDQPQFVLQAIVGALTKMGESGGRVLIAATKERNPALRRLAVGALGQVRPLPRGTVSTLTTALGDIDPEVRAAAAGALGVIGPDAKAALPALNKRAKQDTSEAVRKAASTAITAIKN
jgi:HEAT repeat protein